MPLLLLLLLVHAQGAVNTLAVGNGTLFSGGQDASVRVWSFNQATGTFSQQVRPPVTW
jgi:hypothetical protein